MLRKRAKRAMKVTTLIKSVPDRTYSFAEMQKMVGSIFVCNSKESFNGGWAGKRLFIPRIDGTILVVADDTIDVFVGHKTKEDGCDWLNKARFEEWFGEINITIKS